MPGAGNRGRVTMIASVQRYLTDVGELGSAGVLQAVNALVQHQQSDDDQDGRHQRGVVALHPVLEPGQRTVEPLTGHGVGQYRDRNRRRGDQDVEYLGNPGTRGAEAGGSDR